MLGIALLSSCGSSKKAINGDNTAITPTTKAETSAESLLNKIQSNNPEKKSLTAKVNVTVGSGTKSMSTNGTLKMENNNVIFVSLVDPILGITEVGRMEFTPEKVQIIDRINKQYISVPYSDVSFLKATNVDFNTLQALFWNEVFEPGKESVNAEDFEFNNDDNNIGMTLADNVLTYNFSASKETGLLNKTNVTGTNNKSYKLDVSYTDFTSFSGGYFPKGLNLSFTSGTQTMTLAFELSSLKNSTDWTELTSVSSKYKKADSEKFFKKFIK